MKFAKRVCLECGRTIREGAWGGSVANFRRHVEAHERKRQEAEEKSSRPPADRPKDEVKEEGT